MGFLSSDTTNSASSDHHANAHSPAETPVETHIIDSLIAQPAVPSFGAVLPPFENEAFMSQRHEVNPAIALNLLGEIQQKVRLWQEQLRQLAHAIHAITAQGPMVNGWLESSVALQHKGTKDASKVNASCAEASLLRHGDADALMQYVDALESRRQEDDQTVGQVMGKQPVGSHVTKGDNRPGNAIAQYRLCSLSEDGSVRSQPCPPEQMASVSTAIARYQKFKQLMAQKDVLESKLQITVDDLTAIRARLQ